MNLQAILKELNDTQTKAYQVMTAPKVLEQDEEYIKLSLQGFKDALADLWRIDAYNDDKWNTELGEIEELANKLK